MRNIFSSVYTAKFLISCLAWLSILAFVVSKRNLLYELFMKIIKRIYNVYCKEMNLTDGKKNKIKKLRSHAKLICYKTKQK